MGQKDRVTGGLGELLDAGSDVDGVPISVNSSLLPPPMVPAITLPVLIPIPVGSSPANRSATWR
jgi:hypothetical protein